ncbi:MAG: UMP kinase [Patescibacteria group bacterium]
MKNIISQTAPIVISVGGSIVVPKTGIDVAYLKKFKTLISQQVKTGRRFIIIVGGGYTAREYQGAASKIVKLTAEDLDWLGIHATRLNGHLLRTVFRDIALHRVVKDPTRPIKWSESVLIAAGWKPGWSTDYVAVRLAKKFGAERVINLTNIDAVYDKDPSRFDDAVAYDRIAWKDFRKIVGSKWIPGANAPFDPIASKLAHKWGLAVAIANGRDLNNVKNIIDCKKFKGTVIE